jgi:hypothetical protein
MICKIQLLSLWNIISINFSQRLEIVHSQLKLISVLSKSNSDEDLISYQAFLNRIASQKDITALREDLLRISGGSFSDEPVLRNIWIIKPVGLSCGEKISLSKDFHTVLRIIKSFDLKCVVQKYIENPLLVRNSRKFDIRQWILIVSLDPLVIFGFSECYLRLTSSSFNMDDENLNNPFMHLCNHAIQKSAVESLENEKSSSFFEGMCETMMTQQEFDHELRTQFPSKISSSSSSESIFQNVLLPKIKQISVDVVNSVRDRLLRVGKGFEWLGLDLMVTDTLDVRLIEVNTSPDISCSTPVTTQLVNAAIPDLFQFLLDEDALSINPSSSAIPRVVDCANDKITCEICEGNEERHIPHWCCWYIDKEPFNALHVASLKRKKLKLQLNCQPSDKELLDEIITVVTNQHSQSNDEGDDEL